ncbi:unnamed protein product [Brassica oleracea var. botrytis]
MNTHPDESLLSFPGANKETRRITGEDEPETNHSHNAAKSNVADLQIDEKINRLQSIFNLRLTCMRLQTPL